MVNPEVRPELYTLGTLAKNDNRILRNLIQVSSRLIHYDMGGKWRIPPREHVRPYYETLVINLYNLSLSAEIAIEMRRRGMADEETVEFDNRPLNSWLKFLEDNLGEDLGQIEKLTSGAKRAFGKLLGFEKMRPWDTSKAKKLIETLEGRLFDIGEEYTPLTI